MFHLSIATNANSLLCHHSIPESLHARRVVRRRASPGTFGSTPSDSFADEQLPRAATAAPPQIGKGEMASNAERVKGLGWGKHNSPEDLAEFRK